MTITPTSRTVTIPAGGTSSNLDFDLSFVAGLDDGVYDITVKIDGVEQPQVVTLRVGAAPAANINVIAVDAGPDPVYIGEAWYLRATVKNEGNLAGTADIVLGYWTTGGSKAIMATRTVTLNPGQQTTVETGGTATTVGDWRMYAEGPDTYLEDTLYVRSAPPQTGTIRVSIVDAVPAIAPVYLDGTLVGQTANGGLDITEVPTGSHTVSVGDVTGYVTPAPKTVSVTAGVTTTVSFDYLRVGQIVLSTLTVTPAQIDSGGTARVTVTATNVGEVQASATVTISVTPK